MTLTQRLLRRVPLLAGCLIGFVLWRLVRGTWLWGALGGMLTAIAILLLIEAVLYWRGRT